MRICRRHFATITIFTLAACSGGSDSEAPVTLETDEQKASYGIGLNVGGNLSAAGDHIDIAALVKGIEDAIAGRDPLVEHSELQEVMTRFNETVQTSQAAAMEEAREKNTAEGEAFQAENGARDGVVTTASGLQYEALREGDGAMPESGQRVTIHYRGTLTDGTQFDSSYDRGEPATFAVDGVITGFTEALKLMKVGSHFRVVIPGELAYGPQGSGRLIGPNQTLIFEIELLGIE